MFALDDVNSFYASCEKVFRLDLRNRPVVVLSNNDGCVITRSAEAKRLGIKMGVPWCQLKTAQFPERSSRSRVITSSMRLCRTGLCLISRRWRRAWSSTVLTRCFWTFAA